MNYTLLEVVTEATITVFDVFLIYFWARAFSDKKEKNKLIVFGINMIVFIAFLMITLFVTNSLVLILATFCYSFVISCYGNRKIVFCLFLALVYCMIVMISEMMTGGMLMIFENKPLEIIISNQETRFFGNLITKITILTIVGIIYLKNKKKIKIQENKKNLYLMILPISTVIILYQMSRYNYSFTNVQDGMLNLIGILGLIAANISVILLFEKKSQYEDQKNRELFLKEEIINQKEYYRALEVSQEEIYHLRHDMKNTFIALSGYIKEKNLVAAQNYLSNYTHIMENTEKILNSGYFAIDALINAKINKAKEKEIELKHKVYFPLNISIDEMDLCIILGNSLDNAIEAVEKIEKEDKRIVLNIHAYNKELFIYLENSMSGDLIEKDGILLSTKKDKLNHGYGLENILRIIELYNGEMHYKVENNIFNLYVTLKIEE